ncbi:hypothetical protein E5983_00740 [Streptococcus danieliae]|uniref:Uncharacterized protein n=1 Tax=Streptococcus danieliae TaxID=747656 RepID=A0A7X3G6V8_9STRE|nr:hypothetical protein [Streptococcus danieliae]MVX58201.1 hypothetical protein [Streptococcus danieliae]
MLGIPWLEWLEIFNTITTPIAFIITIYTFNVARATSDKLEETREISRLNAESNLFLGHLDAIKIVIDKNDNLKNEVPKNILASLYNTLTDIETRYPRATQNNTTLNENLQKLTDLCKQEHTTFEEVTKPFKSIYNIISIRKDGI